MLRLRVVQCSCTQYEGELLHLYEVCLLVISVEHMSQVQVWVDGPGFVSTSPDRARSPASHMSGSMAGLPKKRLNKTPLSRGAGSDWCRFGRPLLLGDVPFWTGLPTA